MTELEKVQEIAGQIAVTFLQEFGFAVSTPVPLAHPCARQQTRFSHDMRTALQVFGR